MHLARLMITSRDNVTIESSVVQILKDAGAEESEIRSKIHSTGGSNELVDTLMSRLRHGGRSGFTGCVLILRLRKQGNPRIIRD